MDYILVGGRGNKLHWRWLHKPHWFYVVCISTCNVCDSIYHWAKDCPNSFDNLQKKNVQSKEPEKFTLYSDNMKQFLKETCTKNVCGETKLLCWHIGWRRAKGWWISRRVTSLLNLVMEKVFNLSKGYTSLNYRWQESLRRNRCCGLWSLSKEAMKKVSM